jgi:putative DNA primase/helicase
MSVRTVHDTIRKAGALTLSPSDPMPTARAFVKARHSLGELATLHHHRGGSFAWTGSRYAELDSDTIRADIYAFLENALRWDTKTNKAKPFQPTASKVSDALDALRAVTNLPADLQPPAWLNYTPDMCPPAAELLCCANGLLHLPTLELQPATPTFFAINGLDFPHDRDAPEPQAWLAFLHQLWPDDDESIATLQEMAGYFLTADTRQQKLFLIVGPKRSGKGTIARVLTELLGRGNVCAPTLASMGENFGLWPLIGKTLAVIADARVSGRSDQAIIAERLLSISGEDSLTIDRKYASAWTGRLATRFLILTNELPRLTDASGALASRFVVLMLTESFYGREDPGLTEKLLQELPGILNWAIAGWQRLQARRHFVQPTSSREAIEQLEDLGSPIGAFVRERCSTSPAAEVESTRLFEAWKSWSTDQGRDHPGTLAWFGRDLRAVLPNVSTTQRRSTYAVVRVFRGVTLR